MPSLEITEKNLLTGKIIKKKDLTNGFNGFRVSLFDKPFFSSKDLRNGFPGFRVSFFDNPFVSSIISSPAAIAHRLFIPRGNVAPEYVYFQACDSIQATCSYLRGILAIHSTLVGVGVGDSQASALSAVATFVLKDGSGMMGSLLFSYGYSHIFDSEVKFWRLFADFINDVGLTLEVIAPLFKDYFLVITVFANICKSLCGVAAGATRVAISQHFASEGNISEVQAKEGTQETFVSMVGLMLGSFLLSRGLSASIHVRLIFFLVLTIIHVYANYLAVKVLQLRTLNRGRLRMILSDSEEKKLHPENNSSLTKVDLVTPELAAMRESIIPAHYIDFWMFWIKRLFTSSGSAAKAGCETEGCTLRFGCSFQVLVTQAKTICDRNKQVGVWSDHITVVEAICIDNELQDYKTRTLTEILKRKDLSIHGDTFFVVIDEKLNTKSVALSDGISNSVVMLAYDMVLFNHKSVCALIQNLKRFKWDVSTLHLDEEGIRLITISDNINDGVGGGGNKTGIIAKKRRVSSFVSTQ